MPSDAAATQKERLAWLAILDNAPLAQSFVAGMTPQEFAADRRTFYAVTRCLEIISEHKKSAGSNNRHRSPRDDIPRWTELGNATGILSPYPPHVPFASAGAPKPGTRTHCEEAQWLHVPTWVITPFTPPSGAAAHQIKLPPSSTRTTWPVT